MPKDDLNSGILLYFKLLSAETFTQHASDRLGQSDQFSLAIRVVRFSILHDSLNQL